MPRRLFVAIDLAAPVMAALAARVAQVRGLAPRARWAAPGTGHLTLAFLGATPDSRVAAIAAAVGDAVRGHGPFDLGVAGCGLFGGGRRPRVLWAGVRGDLDALHALQRAVADGLRGAGCDMDTRPFRPHLTLARARAAHGDPALAAAARALDGLDAGEQPVADVVLYESHLGRAGARHEALGRWPLIG